MLGQLVDQFKTQLNQAKSQATMDRDFHEGLTRQLNSYTKSVADLAEKLYSKTLELSQTSPRRTTTTVTPPTPDSASSPQLYFMTR